MSLVVAALPLLVAVGLIVVLGQSGLRSAITALALTIALVAAGSSFPMSTADTARALASGLLTATGVAYVLLGGVVLYQVLRLGKALEPIAALVTSAIPERGAVVLALVFGVSVFFESTTGFGVGIIVTAPLFMALGFEPLRAAALAILGQCAVPWGALAVGTVLAEELTGIDASTLGVEAVWLGLPFLLVTGIAALRLAGLTVWSARHLGWLLAHIAVLSATLWAATTWISVELAGCLGGLAVVAVSVRARPSAVVPGPAGGSRAYPGAARALAPLGVLLVTITLTRLSTTVTDALTPLGILRLADYDYTLSPVHHPGFWLVVAALVGVGVLGMDRATARSALVAALRQWVPAASAIAAFLCVGALMSASGMTGALASALAGTAGASYPLVAPLIGGLGGFLTASNAASNALFMSLQMEASRSLGLSLETIAGAHNAAGSNLSGASPGRVILAAAVAGQPGGEGKLLRQVLPVGVAGLAGTVFVVWLKG